MTVLLASPNAYVPYGLTWVLEHRNDINRLHRDSNSRLLFHILFLVLRKEHARFGSYQCMYFRVRSEHTHTHTISVSYIRLADTECGGKAADLFPRYVDACADRNTVHLSVWPMP
jgi:hypothetical protein